MSRTARTSAAAAAAAAPASFPTTRQNEYFVPRDGIDREVISADICRYLGNDALVRPGSYDDPDTRQVVHGYYITAYRNLTTAMIEDLKADSARWDNERRQQSARTNAAPGGHYRHSETHQSRQQAGPTNERGGYPSDPYDRDGYESHGRYPGSGAQGYHGVGVPQYQQQQQPQHPAYQAPNAAYGNYQQQSPPASNSRYYQAAASMDQAFSGQDNYVAQGTNRPQYPEGYSGSRMPSSGAAGQAPLYASSGSSQPGYPATAYHQQQYPGGQVPASTAAYPNAYSNEAPYGRGHSATPQQQGFPAQSQQYGENPSTRSSVTPSNAQTPTTGATKRRSDRDDDRHGATDRHQRPPRR